MLMTAKSEFARVRARPSLLERFDFSHVSPSRVEGGESDVVKAGESGSFVEAEAA